MMLLVIVIKSFKNILLQISYKLNKNLLGLLHNQIDQFKMINNKIQEK